MHAAYRFSAVVLVVVALTAADWPRFRGPNGMGTAEDKGVPVAWGPKDAVQSVPILGRGNSSPVISKDRLFLQAASEDGSERFLHCYDIRTMKLLWTATVSGGVGKTHAKNTLASSTPAADGDRVVALFWDGRDISLHAFDFAGKPLWQVPLGPFTSQHGAGQSPVLHAGKVFLNNDQDGRAEFMAFDAATGNKIWSAKRPAFRTCYSTPYVRPHGIGGAEVVIASTAGITAYDPNDGKVRWQWDWKFDVKPLRNVGSPVEGAGTIFAIAGDGDGSRHMVAVTPPGKDGTEPKLAWEKKRGTPYVPCPLVRGDYIYWVSDTGFAACVEAKTGKTIFDERFTTGITASPLLINGEIFCVDERGNAFAFPAEPKFSRPRKTSIGENVSATPAVADGRLFIRGEKHLFVIGEKTGERAKP